MKSYHKLNHSVWECKYHIVFIPKCRQRVLYGQIRKDIGQMFHKLSMQKGCIIEEGKIMKDHVHMLISIPPKYSISSVVGHIKGKSAIMISRRYRGRKRNYTGESFWARGYFVSTVGRDETVIREYIKNQEKEDKMLDQIPLFR